MSLRYEVKLVVDGADRDRVRADLLLLPTALRTIHPTRIVQSIYLDTHDGRAVDENLAGVGERTKLRFRWYGDAIVAAPGTLECKRRRDSLGGKDLLTIGAPMPLAGALGDEFVGALRAALPTTERARLDGHRPTQWIRYRREYLGDVSGALRITIDDRITAYDQRGVARLQAVRATPLPDLCIVEAKADLADRERIEDWLQAIGFRPSRCSKYVMACLPSEAPQPSRWGA
ncbi:MAG: hypothetical protein RL398_2033 [Planctomycetota bacterium]|jgi:hypothetical protein